MLRPPSLSTDPMPPRITQKSDRPRASNRIMVGQSQPCCLLRLKARPASSPTAMHRNWTHPRGLTAALRNEHTTASSEASGNLGRGAGCQDEFRLVASREGELFLLTTPFIELPHGRGSDPSRDREGAGGPKRTNSAVKALVCRRDTAGAPLRIGLRP